MVNCGSGEQLATGSVSILDFWGDVSSWRNCGLDSKDAHSDTKATTWKKYFSEKDAAGLLGGLRKLKAKAEEANHKLDLAFSIGGWSLSGYFSAMAKDEKLRTEFVKSIIYIFEQFPMFSAVDIDWEYPGGGGLFPDLCSPDDGANYAKLVAELRSEMNKLDQGSAKEISIAAGCNLKTLDDSHIPDLIKAGVNNVYLMAYDFFGFTWAPVLAHHTNLKMIPDVGKLKFFSAGAAVKHLLDKGVTADHLHMGYANYGRCAAKADLTTGMFDKTRPPLGSFEPGAVEFFDAIKNYIQFSEESRTEGKNGFKFYTDDNADADYLFSKDTGHFISLDTPRTVKAKAKYVLDKKMAGMFLWSADQDDGLLYNAAREGLGYSATKTNFDMKIYEKGEVENLQYGQKEP